MLDDSKPMKLAGASGARMIEEMIQIKKCQVPRKPSQRWARNLRLLAFDDGVSDDDDDKPTDAAWESGSSSVVGCQLDALEYFSAFPLGGDRWNTQSCTTCRGFPEFPTDGRIKNLRLVCPKAPEGDKWAAGNCSHYCSVSYCWSNNETGRGSYQVRLPDGTTRPNRAPNAVLHRAIAFAIQNQMRFIWIDQECIEQDDAQDKELAIQSMDVVYQRVRFSLGMFNNTIASQKQIEALQTLCLWGDQGYTSDSSHLAEHTAGILDVMENLSTDPWNTRGWILQENFLAGKNMKLLVTLDEDCDVAKEGPLETIRLSSDIAMDFETLTRCASYARSLLLTTIGAGKCYSFDRPEKDC